MNNDILLKVDEVIDTIKNTKDYKEYILLKERLNNNAKIVSLINEIKAIQKELVKLEIEKRNTSSLEKEYSEKLNKLESIPLYRDYTYVVNRLNEMFSAVKQRLDDYFYEKLN